MIERAKAFLSSGDRVKISLRFRGQREMANIGVAKDIMKSVLANFDGIAVLDTQLALNGKELSCILRKGTAKPQKPQPPGKITITVR